MAKQEESKTKPIHEVALKHIETGMNEMLKGVGTVADGMAAGAKIAGDKAEKLYDAGRLRVRNTLLNKKIKHLFRELGEEMFNLSSEGLHTIMENKEVKNIIKMVKDCKDEIMTNLAKLGKTAEEEEEEDGEEEQTAEEGEETGKKRRRRRRKKRE